MKVHFVTLYFEDAFFDERLLIDLIEKSELFVKVNNRDEDVLNFAVMGC
ncbi:hypothetical protein SL267_22190 [Serratia marcescens]|nr:hypothetical protein SL267_22190 [Serratia marcescens]